MSNNKSLTLNELNEVLLPIKQMLKSLQSSVDQTIESNNVLSSEIIKINSKIDVLISNINNINSNTAKPNKSKKNKTMIEDDNNDINNDSNNDKKSDKKTRTSKKNKEDKKDDDCENDEKEEKGKKSSSKDNNEISVLNIYNYFKKIFNNNTEEYKSIINENMANDIDNENKYVDKDDKELEGSKLLNKKMSVYYNYIKADKKLLSELNKYYKAYLSNPEEFMDKINNLKKSKSKTVTKTKKDESKTKKPKKNDSDSLDDDDKPNKKNKSSNSSEKSFNSKLKLKNDDDDINDNNSEINDDDDVVYDDKI